MHVQNLILVVLPCVAAELMLFWTLRRHFGLIINNRLAVLAISVVCLAPITIFLLITFFGWARLLSTILTGWSRPFIIAVFADISLALWSLKPGRWFESIYTFSRFSLPMFIISGVAFFMCSAGLARILYSDYYPHNSFSQERWKNSESLRYMMSEDLIKSKLLIGKNKSEVTQILGTGTNSDTSNFRNYVMGSTKIFTIGPDVEELHLFFKNDTVVNVEQYNLD